MFASLFLVMLGLCYCSSESDQLILEKPHLSGPSEALLKNITVFNCSLSSHPKNESILLKLFKRGSHARQLGEYTSLAGEPGLFHLVIKLTHEGNLECVASAQNNTNIKPTFSDKHHLKVVEPVKNAEIVVPSGAVELFEGQRLELLCNLAAGNHVSYKWLRNGQLISPSPVHPASHNFSISRATSEDSGSYTCMASNVFSSANSSEVVITVKDVVSAPEISFSVLKEDSHNYSAMVTCQSTKGTPPVTFSFYIGGALVGNVTSEDRSATFKVPLVLGQDSEIQCQADNGNYSKRSQSLPLKVEPVKNAEIVVRSGAVELFEGDPLELLCNLAAGNHVSYKWLLNGRLISPSPVHHKHLLISRATSKDSGSYTCMASNVFSSANSSEVVITVKDVVSAPEISFSVLKEDSHNYSAMVTCQSTKGTPPVTFSFYIGGALVGNVTSEDRSATFKVPLVLGQDSEIQCQADNGNYSKRSQSLPLKVEPVKNAEIVVHSGAVELFEGDPLELLCNLAAGNHVSYKWLLNGRLISPSPVHHKHLLISRATSEDSGSYTCMASNVFSSANSSEVVITVKDVVSAPEISFSVLKEDSHNYSAVVTCQSTKGTPPVTFSLYIGGALVGNVTSEDRSATFKVPVVLGQDSKIQCQADNGNYSKRSQLLPYKVVLVRGPVNITVDNEYDTGEYLAVVGLRLNCEVAEGSHPRYRWFLNNTLLHDRGSFYYVHNPSPKQSTLILSVERRSTGTYHCEVSDSFDNTTAISSINLYVDKEGLSRLPVLVVAVVFGCFTVLILLVSVCCFIGVVYRRRVYGKTSLLGLEMERRVAARGGELDLLDYDEDADLVKAVREDEFDQASEASVDEWPQIAEEEKTLEDEPVEIL
ncbi:Fc receptor-like protein 5 isoform X1 [Toxotes jaculatrix]|uniref:Fc receptor-like protein 5 isoform X1 n=1 Tax=Toxotes jaculatrix TaxID=941984 RepID=UPI001B3B17A2|nr:Fc receptor-like protein 5 isoform X1 [Toxotes jaculatrix]